MKLTWHGTKRVYDRTKMHLNDVLSIISAGAAVDLGLVGGERYFLFYSPPNKSTKIAVVSADRMRLISIWESDYTLPSGIKRITWEMKREARILLQKFLFARIKAKNAQHKGAA